MNITIYRDNSRNNGVQSFIESILDLDLKYLASDLTNYGFNQKTELTEAVQRAIAICGTAEISVRRNFKPVFVYGDGQLARDWRISEFGRKLIILNADPSNPIVAKFQLQMIETMRQHK